MKGRKLLVNDRPQFEQVKKKIVKVNNNNNNTFFVKVPTIVHHERVNRHDVRSPDPKSSE